MRRDPSDAGVLSDANRAWWPIFINIIDRDYPQIADEVLSKAISEQTAKNAGRS